RGSLAQLRGDNVLAALTLSASAASTLAALEEPFSPPRHRGSLSVGRLRPEPPPSACGEVWRERRGREPGLRAALAGQCEFWRALRAAHGAAGRRHRPRAVRGLAPGPAAAEGTRGTPAVPARRRCGRILMEPQPLPCGAGVGTRSPPCLTSPPEVGSHPAGASPTGAAPCSLAPSPIDRPRAEGCRPASGVAGGSACSPLQDPLGEASWAPEPDGDLEKFCIQQEDCMCTNQHSVSS
uniref:Uncharacterized protein n=1 Tax=Macaca mulatta TaxID=9544 RepID=A0A5F8AJZ4_MACMU